MKLRTALLTIVCTVGLSQASHAQASRSGLDSIPKGYWPPKGMCRIWLDRVPARQQPAPTDCPTAVRNKPSNGKVLFGDDNKDKGDSQTRALPFVKKFADDRKP